ncbi:tetratricopeptide repeat protein [Streptomyces nojiriensis]|uniref:tetratricopeptide repeat protein n=1 Tax=Streptomyces nojiriensis TaxID=66374 RepID=UPI0036672BEF
MYFLTVRGDTRTARDLAQDALTRWRAAYGQDADVTASAMEHLARAEVQLGNYRAAVELDEHVIARRSRLGHEHPDMVTAKLNLASDLMALAANTAGPSARAARRALRLQRWIVAVRTRQHGSCWRARTSAAATCWGRTIPIQSASGIGWPSSCARRDGRTGPNR